MKQRVISAVIAFIIVIPLIILGGIPFKIGVSIISLIGLYEFIKCESKENKYPDYIKILSYILMFLFVFTNYSIVIKILFCILILGIPIIFISKDKYNIESFLHLFSNIVILGVVFSYLIKIRNNDINLFIYLFLITVFTDTFAYVGGKIFGKHKLLPSVSPNKTIEGSVIGTIIGTIIPSIFYIYMVDPGMNIILSIMVTLVLSIIGQLGDLFFSSIKRYYNVKDFSNIMPGHGGILDRLDSIIFVIIGYILLINFI